MKRLLFIVMTLVLVSCNEKQKQSDAPNGKRDSIALVHKDTIQLTSKKKKKESDESISPDLSYGRPKNEEELKHWKKKVLEEGDSYYYWQLANYGLENNEMIKYIQAMIKKNSNPDTYQLEYYYFVKKCTRPDKIKLMHKAIGYLIQLSKEKDEKSVLSPFARRKLAKEYREGVYVPKDTVIANYLYNDGCNLDSILKVRKLNK